MPQFSNYLPPTGPRNLTTEYGGGGASTTVPGYPTMRGGGGTEAMIGALLNAPYGQSRQADALEGSGAKGTAPLRQVSAPAREAQVDPIDRQMKQLQLESAQADLAKKKKEGEVWMQNGPYGMQKVSPGTPGAVLWQSG
jgi:hypothetical protein